MKNAILILFIFVINICWGSNNKPIANNIKNGFNNSFATKKTTFNNSKSILNCNENIKAKEKDKAIVKNKSNITVYEPIFETKKVIITKKME